MVPKIIHEHDKSKIMVSSMGHVQVWNSGGLLLDLPPDIAIALAIHLLKGARYVAGEMAHELQSAPKEIGDAQAVIKDTALRFKDLDLEG